MAPASKKKKSDDHDEIENNKNQIPSKMQPDANATTYQYRDFAHIAPDDDDVEEVGLQQALAESTHMAAAQTSLARPNAPFYQPGPPLPLRASGWVRSQRFPVKLYALLNQPSLSEIITWMPHGRSWKVLKPRIFETSVLPVFFESDNYHSFNRVINAWSFRRKSAGPDRGSYFHELFLRGKPHLQKHMRRLPRTHKKLDMKKDQEPDFFMLSQASPLPTLEEVLMATFRKSGQGQQNQIPPHIQQQQRQQQQVQMQQMQQQQQQQQQQQHAAQQQHVVHPQQAVQHQAGQQPFYQQHHQQQQQQHQHHLAQLQQMPPPHLHQMGGPMGGPQHQHLPPQLVGGMQMGPPLHHHQRVPAPQVPLGSTNGHGGGGDDGRGYVVSGPPGVGMYPMPVGSSSQKR